MVCSQQFSYLARHIPHCKFSYWVNTEFVNKQTMLLSENPWETGDGHSNLSSSRSYAIESEDFNLCKAFYTGMSVSEISRLATPQTGFSC